VELYSPLEKGGWDMPIEVPSIVNMLDKMGKVPAPYQDIKKSINEWRQNYLDELATPRDGIQVFNRFVSDLLERAMRGEVGTRRNEAFKKTFRSYEDVTDTRVQQVLKSTGYRFPNMGLEVVRAAKGIVMAKGFSWNSYFGEAEWNYADDYQNDKFLEIDGVSFKTRDLALSAFSNRFVAIDVHISRITLRTGLFVSGYGDPKISSDYKDKQGYLFLHNLLIKLSKETGWPGKGYSPGEIDRTFWYFGRTICKSEPKCSSCPVAEICLTGRAKYSKST
jgi:endonuclease III